MNILVRSTKTCRAIITLLALSTVLLAGCPTSWDQNYLQVVYKTNGATEGWAPIDTNIYFQGEAVTILPKPESLAKDDAPFLGWSVNRNYPVVNEYYADDPWQNILYQPGAKLNYPYWKEAYYKQPVVILYAIWQENPQPEPPSTELLYTTDDAGAITITGYTGSGGELDIAAFFTAQTGIAEPNIVAIDNRVFDRKSLTSVILPKTLASIGSGAFSANDITYLSLPDSVTYIGTMAF
jgi:hypothetical protein